MDKIVLKKVVRKDELCTGCYYFGKLLDELQKEISCWNVDCFDQDEKGNATKHYIWVEDKKEN